MTRLRAVLTVLKDGKIVGYTSTTTRWSVTNTIKSTQQGEKKVRSVEKGDANVTFQTERLDSKWKMVSIDGESLTKMNQSEYKAQNS